VPASASAPTVTRTKATRLIGPYGARAEGSAKTPVPMTVPTTSAVAVGSPNRCGVATDAGCGGLGDAVRPGSVWVSLLMTTALL
jgi:hypothetical protein